MVSSVFVHRVVHRRHHRRDRRLARRQRQRLRVHRVVGPLGRRAVSASARSAGRPRTSPRPSTPSPSSRRRPRRSMSALAITVNMDSPSSVMVTVVCAPSAVMSMVSAPLRPPRPGTAVTIVATDVIARRQHQRLRVHRVVGPLGRRARQRQRVCRSSANVTPPVEHRHRRRAAVLGDRCRRGSGPSSTSALVAVGDGDSTSAAPHRRDVHGLVPALRSRVVHRRHHRRDRLSRAVGVRLRVHRVVAASPLGRPPRQRQRHLPVRRPSNVRPGATSSP